MSALLTKLDMTRAALSEAGYPNARITFHADGPAVALGSDEGAVPDEVCWRAFGLVAAASAESHPCWSCWYLVGDGDDCLADRPLVRDCGVTR